MQELHGAELSSFSLNLDSTFHNEAIQPLQIGEKDTSKCLIQYVPPPE